MVSTTVDLSKDNNSTQKREYYSLLLSSLQAPRTCSTDFLTATVLGECTTRSLQLGRDRVTADTASHSIFVEF